MTTVRPRPILFAATLAAAAVLGTPSTGAAAETQASALRESGRTSQNQPVSLVLSNRLTSVVSFTIGFRARCQTGRTLESGAQARGLRIRDGRFSNSAPGSFPLEGGFAANARASGSGRVGRSTAPARSA